MLIRRIDKADTTIRHVARPQVAGHNDDHLREIHLAVVPQGKRSIIQHTQQQGPQGIASFLDLIEQQDR